MLLQDLILFIYFLLLVLVLTWAFIAYSIIYRRYKTRQLAKVKLNIIETIASSFLHPEDTVKWKWLQKHLKSKRNNWIVANQFVKVNNVIESSEDTILNKLATNTGLVKNISKDLNSPFWFKKAKAIYFCYELRLTDYVTVIRPLKNHTNILVRREAQIALVVMLGWESLKLFQFVKYPISLWQQIRIIEKLKRFHPEPVESYIIEAMDTKNPCVKELVIRVIRLFELNKFKSYTIKQLQAHDAFLADTALDTLSSFTLNTIDLEQINASLITLKTSPFQEKLHLFVTQQNKYLDQHYD